MLGGLFVLTTLYLPKGVVGLWAQIKDKFFSSGGGGQSGNPATDNAEGKV
jgi:urea transport system permease protein